MIVAFAFHTVVNGSFATIYRYHTVPIRALGAERILFVLSVFLNRLHTVL